jgi:acetolactate synthase I/II/III large subunit
MHEAMTGAELVIRLLEREGIGIVPGIPGGANLPLYDALARRGTIRHVLARHEQGAGFMTQGMARSTGKAQACFATSGPGATNLLTAIADAKLDSVPIVCITGQVPSSLIGTDAFQEVDTYGLTIPIAKHNFLARTAGELLHVIPEAFRIARSGRPGPVVVDIPKDVQCGEVRVHAWPEPGQRDPAPWVDPRDLRRAAGMIAAARRPMLFLGGGVIQADAGAAARELAERCSMPVAMSLMGLGAIPSDHPLAMGMLGMHAARFTNLALQECDLLIAAGVRFDDRATGKVAEFCPSARVIHIDIDQSELDKIKAAHLGIVGDVREVLEQFCTETAPRDGGEWLRRIAELRRVHPLVLPGLDDPASGYGLVRLAAGHLDERAIVATDVGQHQMRTAQAFPFRAPRQWLTSGGLGTMGFGIPAAIGAALAHPGRKVVCFTGDGSMLMNIQELATAVEEKVDLTIVLMNNLALGLVRQQQELFYGKRFFASQYGHSVDFPAIARGFGLKVFDLAGAPDPARTLARAMAERGPCLVHALVDVEESVYPMVPPGAANKDMIGGEHAACG